MNSKAIKRQLIAALAMVLVAALALGSSTYAWFVTNTKVKASAANITATAASSLLISAADANEWATTYEFTDINTTFAPVSTIGTSNGDAFTFFKQKDWAKDSGQSNAITVNKVAALETAEKTGGANPFYYEKSFDIKAAQACKLYLDTDTKFTNTAGSMNKTLRLALVVKKSDGTHVKTVIYQVDKDDNTTAANRFNTTLSSEGCNGIAKAVSAVGAEGAITSAALAVTVPTEYDIVGQGLLATADPKNGLNPTTLDHADVLYTFAQPNEVCKVTAYIWMEGCDFDCTNNTVSEITGDVNKVVANLGFCAGTST